jgi:hypothetical protein
MAFDLTALVLGLRSNLTEFLSLVEEPRWQKRVAHLRRELASSASRAKVSSDYHWLELELADQLELDWATGPAGARIVNPDTLAALCFASATVTAHARLSSRGRNVLLGRIRDSLKSDTGFSSLFLELDMARRLVDTGCEVEFTDMEGTGQYDLRFWSRAAEGEVECKSLSTDAGRKIHRREFYRLIDGLQQTIESRMADGAQETIVVTLDGRLPADDASQEALRTAIRRFVIDAKASEARGDFFSLTRDGTLVSASVSPPLSLEHVYDAHKARYGAACHVSGGLSPSSSCLIVVRSRRDDDTSAPVLEAVKKATSQFSGERPAFIAIQYDDIRPEDLVLPHLRRRAGLLSYYLFLEKGASHVAGTYFTPYGGFGVSEVGIGVPAFGVPNPKPKFAIRHEDYGVFFDNISDPEFAQLVGAPIPTENISYVSLLAEDGSDGSDT